MTAPSPTPRIAALFEAARTSGAATVFALPGGAPLFLAGEAASAVFFLRSGLLRVTRAGDAPLGAVLPGEPAGEMAALEGGAHGASVAAARDSEVWSRPRETFLAAAARDPALMAEVAQIIVQRVRAAAVARPPSPPASVGVFALTDAVAARPLAEAIAAEARRLDRHAAVVAEGLPEPDGADLILYAVEAGEIGWSRRAARQAEAAFGLIEGAAPAPPKAPPAWPSRPWDGLLVLWPDDRRQSGAARWTKLLNTICVHHLAAGEVADAARLARALTGRSIGLVLSGGSARGLAHVGAIRALRRRGVPIDAVGGASMGAVIALAVAMGWPQAEMERRIRLAFSQSSPISDIAFPFLSLSRGGIVRRRLAEHFGDVEIADLARPFFCLASDLTTGEPVVSDAGLAREAVLASLSIPGVLPPVIEDDHVLVDGAVMNNYPADILRARHAGPIIGVDVGKADSIRAADLMTPTEIVRWLISGAWRRGPPIVSILMRAATVSAGREVIASRAMTDLLIEPEVEDIEIRDWGAFDRAARAGEIAADKALDAGVAALAPAGTGNPPS